MTLTTQQQQLATFILQLLNDNGGRAMQYEFGVSTVTDRLSYEHALHLPTVTHWLVDNRLITLHADMATLTSRGYKAVEKGLGKAIREPRWKVDKKRLLHDLIIAIVTILLTEAVRFLIAWIG